MSDYGLITKNDSGDVQIDSKYRNLSLHQSGTKTVSNVNGTWSTISLTSSTLVPLIAIKPNTDDFVSVLGVGKTSSNYDKFYMITQPYCSTSVAWRSYRENPSPSNETYGLRVYNSNEELCFDSGLEYLKIYAVEVFSNFPLPDDETPYVDVSHPGISDPYYILSGSGFYYQEVTDDYGSSWIWWTLTMMKLSSTSVRIGWSNIKQLEEPSGDNILEGYMSTPLKLVICKP